MIILSKVLKESNQIKILAIKVAAKRTLDNALLLIRESWQLENGEIDGCATFQHKRFRQQCTVMEIVEYLHQSHHLFEVVSNKALLLGDDVKSLFVI